jgi:hypothetical protein
MLELHVVESPLTNEFMLELTKSNQNPEDTKGGNQNPYIEEEQTTQWPKVIVRKMHQASLATFGSLLFFVCFVLI